MHFQTVTVTFPSITNNLTLLLGHSVVIITCTCKSTLWIQEVANTQSQFLAGTAATWFYRRTSTSTKRSLSLWRRAAFRQRWRCGRCRGRGVRCDGCTESRWVPSLAAVDWRTCNDCSRPQPLGNMYLVVKKNQATGHRIKIEYQVKVLTSQTTQNMSFQRRSSQPFSWLDTQ